jgi:hypothetical protein
VSLQRRGEDDPISFHALCKQRQAAVAPLPLQCPCAHLDLEGKAPVLMLTSLQHHKEIVGLMLTSLQHHKEIVGLVLTLMQHHKEIVGLVLTSMQHQKRYAALVLTIL